MFFFFPAEHYIICYGGFDHLPINLVLSSVLTMQQVPTNLDVSSESLSHDPFSKQSLDRHPVPYFTERTGLTVLPSYHIPHMCIKINDSSLC
uniref:Putative ovule protein n=1 Tax=Solanum chacoense TaxID=4108 RepID=A0A0V0HKV3_SOLCH